MGIGIPVAILILAVLIFVHEMGHFLVAKFFGVGVLEFAIGFGPKLFSWQTTETTYTLRAIPLGGFVRMTGDDPRMVHGELLVEEGSVGGASPIEGSQSDLTPTQIALVNDESRWFLRQGYVSKCAIVIAGPLFNFLFAWSLAVGLCFWIGVPEMANVPEGPVTIGSISPGMPAAAAGLKDGDKVKTIDGRPIVAFSELLQAVRDSGGKELEIVIERPVVGDSGDLAGAAARTETVSVKVKPTADEKEIDVLEGRDASQATYRIGVGMALTGLTYRPIGFGEAVYAGGAHVVDLTYTTLRIFKALLSGVLSPRKTIGGPLSIIEQTAKSTQAGFPHVLEMMILLNVSLGVMNLFPVPVLDGGHLVMFTLELLKGGRLSFRFQDAATRVGMAMLLLLMVFAFGNDIVRMIPWK